MNSTTLLTGAHRRSYRRIFQQPASSNLAWHDVRSLFRHVGQVEEEPNGNLTVTRNGQTLVLPPPRTKDVAAPDELAAVRDFLTRSEPTLPATNGREPHWLLVIDPHESRLYRAEVNGGCPERILLPDPDAHFRHVRNPEEFSKGPESSDRSFAPLAKALRDAGQIFVVGASPGASAEMERFIAWLKHHHPELAARIIGSLVADEPPLTEGQLLDKSREFYAHHWLSPV